MAVTTLIPIGVPFTLVQSQVYALPVRRTSISASTTNAALEVCQTYNGTFIATPAVNGIMPETSAPFIRCTAASGIVITCKGV